MKLDGITSLSHKNNGRSIGFIQIRALCVYLKALVTALGWLQPGKAEFAILFRGLIHCSGA